MLINPQGGGVDQLFNQPTPIGPLDNAAWLVLLPDDTPTSIMVPIEVKNIREWIYPQTAELYQLLAKAAQLQVDNADRHFLPVLICRRCHRTTFRIAKDLGFFVIETTTQAVLPHSEAPQDMINAVNAELAYNLVQSLDANPHVVNTLARSLPKGALRIAARWRVTAPLLGHHFSPLRYTNLMPADRRSRMIDLTTDALAIEHTAGGWGKSTIKHDEVNEESFEEEDM